MGAGSAGKRIEFFRESNIKVQNREREIRGSAEVLSARLELLGGGVRVAGGGGGGTADKTG
jgi:hypothetical protein